MQIIALAFMSIAVTSIRCFSVSRRLPLLVSVQRRSFRIDATKYTTADLQGKMYPPASVSDGFDLMEIGIGRQSHCVRSCWSLCPKLLIHFIEAYRFNASFLSHL